MIEAKEIFKILKFKYVEKYTIISKRVSLSFEQYSIRLYNREIKSNILHLNTKHIL